jgi:phosphoglycolate phosphatase-like HAD superfamily hydrolase
MIMGRAAKTRTAAALWSGAGRDLLLAETPDFTLESPAQLFDLL